MDTKWLKDHAAWDHHFFATIKNIGLHVEYKFSIYLRVFSIYNESIFECQILSTVEVKKSVGRQDEKVTIKYRRELVFFFQSFDDFLFDKKTNWITKRTFGKSTSRAYVTNYNLVLNKKESVRESRLMPSLPIPRSDTNFTLYAKREYASHVVSFHLQPVCVSRTVLWMLKRAHVAAILTPRKHVFTPYHVSEV